MYVIQIKFPLRKIRFLVELTDTFPITSKDLKYAKVFHRKARASMARSYLICRYGAFGPDIIIKPLAELTNEQQTHKHFLARAMDTFRDFIKI